eukprot:TRINITY_DN65623_c0_g1_i1.p1 TRINITY_DN65623_c0_g1~~TRINITY_DN65623_c0_g1_i1.p1  ORF type:complete len:448 (+),score=95.40 TRINITY_DN65623_c0_g1_i1:74-1345(+)
MGRKQRQERVRLAAAREREISCLRQQLMEAQGAAVTKDREGALRLGESIARAAVRHAADRELATKLASMLSDTVAHFAAQRQEWMEHSSAVQLEAAARWADTDATRKELHVATPQGATCARATVLRLHEDEAEQQSELLCSEAAEWDLLLADFLHTAEGIAQAERLSHEGVGQGEEVGKQRAPGALEAKKKRRQRRRRRRAKRNDATNCTVDSPPADQSDGGLTVRVHSSVASPSTADSSDHRSDSKALLIDNVCFWVAAFAPKSWASTCSDAARSVFGVMRIYQLGWHRLDWYLGRFQSMGADNPSDLDYFGPEMGWIYYYRVQVQALAGTVRKLCKADPSAGPVRFLTNWVLDMDLRANMYEEMRLRHKALYIAARCMVDDHEAVAGTLEGVLKAFDKRKEEEDDDGADDANNTAVADSTA